MSLRDITPNDEELDNFLLSLHGTQMYNTQDMAFTAKAYIAIVVIAILRDIRSVLQVWHREWQANATRIRLDAKRDRR